MVLVVWDGSHSCYPSHPIHTHLALSVLCEAKLNNDQTRSDQIGPNGSQWVYSKWVRMLKSNPLGSWNLYLYSKSVANTLDPIFRRHNVKSGGWFTIIEERSGINACTWFWGVPNKSHLQELWIFPVLSHLLLHSTVMMLRLTLTFRFFILVRISIIVLATLLHLKQCISYLQALKCLEGWGRTSLF